MAKGKRRDYRKEAQKWVDTTAARTQEWKDGVAGVQEAPGTAAVAKQQKLVNNFMESVNSGKWAANTSAVSLTEWQGRCDDEAAGRLSSGAQKALSRREAFTADFGPKRDQLADQVNSMPDATPEQRDAKQLAMSRGMRKLRYERKRR